VQFDRISIDPNIGYDHAFECEPKLIRDLQIRSRRGPVRGQHPGKQPHE